MRVFYWEYQLTDTVALKRTHGTILMDAEDAARFKGVFTDSEVSGVVTAKTKVDGRRAILARVILDAPRDMVVDHINGNRLDNRRSNLRVCSQAQNLRNRKKHKNNTSGYKGVRLERGRWVARIQSHGKRYYLGGYDCPKKAHAAYCAAADRHHGEFANHG